MRSGGFDPGSPPSRPHRSEMNNKTPFSDDGPASSGKKRTSRGARAVRPLATWGPGLNARLNPTAAQKSERREARLLIQRALVLPLLERFQVFEALRADLAENLSDQNEVNRIILLRQQAVEAIRDVAMHLELEPGVAPKTDEFNRAAAELDLGWTSSKVARVWERWRFCCDAYLGRRTAETPSRRRRRQWRGRPAGPRTDEQRMAGLQAWLAEPGEETMDSYNEFVEGYNADLPEDRQRLVRAEALQKHYALNWARLVAVAKGNMTIEDAMDSELVETLPRGPEAIVGLAAVARVLGTTIQDTNGRAGRDENFPVPVAEIMGNRAWLLSDIRRYRKGLAAPKREVNQLQAEYMDARQVREQLNMTKERFGRAIYKRRWDWVPPPAGAVTNGTFYWRRREVEYWLKGRGLSPAGD